MHKAYQDFVKAKVSAAVAASKAAAEVKHKGLKGQLREIFIRDLLRPFLPSDVGVGTGEVISHTDQTSTQQDVIIYDRAILPPVVFEQACGVFPIESVLYTIEVKTRLGESDLQSALESAADLSGFSYAAGEYDKNDQPREHEVTKAMPLLFAFDSSWTDKRVIDVCTQVLADKGRQGGEPNAGLKAICVAGKGCWYRSGQDGKSKETLADEGHSEIMRFLSLILHGYKDIAASRRNPRLGLYMVQRDDG